jgi:hypothetical protein
MGMTRLGISYREFKEIEFADMIKRKHEFYKCSVCNWFDGGASIEGLCNHPDTQELTQATHKVCPFKMAKGG